MGIYDLFSKRKKRERGEVPDVFISGPIPHPFRVQVVHIWEDTIGSMDSSEYNNSERSYEVIRKQLCKEYGKFSLIKSNLPIASDLLNWFLQTTSDDEVLDAIELSFLFIVNNCDSYYMREYSTSMKSKDAVNELNARFLEHGLGYQFEDHQIIPFSSKFVHEEVVKSALLLVSNEEFTTVDEEFRTGYEHYRHRSMMKIICTKHNWAFSPKDSAAKLIQVLIDNRLIPPELKASLESGLLPIRNQLGGHGAGAKPREVTKELTAFALHLAASNIVLLADADRAKN
jgi:hypothetical protein